jgi:predicted dehydrogenase
VTDPAPVSPGTVRWGILAPGGIARAFANDLTLHGHRIEAVGSRTLGNAEAFAAEFGVPRAYGSYEDLVADPDIDIVYVASPHNRHAAHATLALEAGKHVLVEKAFTLTGAQAREVTTLGRGKELLVMEAMWTRFLPHMAYVRRIIADGVIGEVRSVHADHSQHLPFPDDHRLNNPATAGGALLDLGVYPVSLAYDILGPVAEVSARATFKPTGVDSSIATIMHHENGTISTSFSTMETRGPNVASIQGTRGRVDIASIWYMPARVSVYDERSNLIAEWDEPVSGRGMQYQASEAERLVGIGATESPLMPAFQSVDIMTILDECRRQIALTYPDE